MTISPGTNFDDPRFHDDGRTPARRMRDGDYYVADDELSALTRRAVRLLGLYEQAHPSDPDIARYLLSQVLGQVGRTLTSARPCASITATTSPSGTAPGSTSASQPSMLLLS